jgi:hypothetical protein
MQKQICDLNTINSIIKEQGLDLCIISYGGSCTNALVKVLIENGYNCGPEIWSRIICHCPEYIEVDVPIIYIYDNIIKSYLSIKRRGIYYSSFVQQRLSNNENIALSDENLLKLMMKQYEIWSKVNKPNVMIIKSSELFESAILDKLQGFLKKDLKGFPMRYIRPMTELASISYHDKLLFKKYALKIDD